MRNMSKVLSNKAVIYILLLTALLFASACSDKKADIKWDVSDKDIVAAKAQPAPSIKANIYMAIELTHHLLLVQCCANSQRLKSWPSQKLRYRFSLNHQRNLPHIDKVMFSGSMAYGIMVS